MSFAGVKFFDQNAAGLSNGGSIVDFLGSGASVVQTLLGKSRYTYWSTVGSNDGITETLILTFPSYTFNRLIFGGHDWKEFFVQYWDGSAFVDWSNSPSGLDGWPLTSGSTSLWETHCTDTTSYFEVSPTTSTQLKITIRSTQTANAEKTANFIIVTNELGTLQGYPGISPATATRNARVMVMPSGKKKIIKAPESFDCILDFSLYSSNVNYRADLNLMYQLHDRDVPFLMWPCGGRRGTSYFKYPLRLMRLQDIFLAQLVTDIAGLYDDNYYGGAVNLGQLEFVEHV